MKYRMTSTQKRFDIMKVEGYVEDKKQKTLAFIDMEIPMGGPWFSVLANDVFREWERVVIPFILAVSKTFNKYSTATQFCDSSEFIGVMGASAFSWLDVDSIARPLIKNKFIDFYSVMCPKPASNKLTYPDVLRMKKTVHDCIDRGYMPDFIGMFDYKFFGTSSKFFEIQSNVFEFLLSVAKNKLTTDTVAFPRETVVRLIN